MLGATLKAIGDDAAADLLARAVAANAEIKAWAKTQSSLHYFEAGVSEITCGHYDKPSPVGHCENYADDFGHVKRAGYELIFRFLSLGRP